MFTGLVQDIATIESVQRRDESSVMSIKTKLAAMMNIGDSISINGVCLTATAIAGNVISVDVMIQTLKLSNLGGVAEGSKVNAELATRVDSRLGGHIVQGHVDGVATVVSRTPGEKWEQFIIEVPADLSRYIVNQGSIAVDGVSLTVGEISDANNQVTLWLIPETLAKTNLSLKAPGDIVNIEVDILAKYVERLISKGGGRG